MQRAVGWLGVGSVTTLTLWAPELRLPILYVLMVGASLATFKELRGRSGLFAFGLSLSVGVAYEGAQIASKHASWIPKEDARYLSVALPLAILFAFAICFGAKPYRYLFCYLLTATIVAYLSSSTGGPAPMLNFFQAWFKLTPEGAHTATIALRKTIHFTFYGTVALTGWKAFRSIEALPKTALGFALLLTLYLAGFDELRQSGESNRTGSIYDVALDLAGAAVFLGIAETLRIRSTRRARTT